MTRPAAPRQRGGVLLDKPQAPTRPIAADVMVATTRGGMTHGDHEECVRRLLSHHGDINWSSAVGSQLVQQRNDIVQRFLDETSLGWLFLLDSDMTFAPDALDALLAAAHVTERPVVGGITVSWDPPTRRIFPTMYRRDDDGVLRPVLGWVPGGLLPVDATGAACLLIHRSVLEALRDAPNSLEFPWFDLGRNGEYGGTGEDLEFCRRVRALDIPIHVHTGVPFGHLKTIELSIADFVNQLGDAESSTQE